MQHRVPARVCGGAQCGDNDRNRGRGGGGGGGGQDVNWGEARGTIRRVQQCCCSCTEKGKKNVTDVLLVYCVDFCVCIRECTCTFIQTVLLPICLSVMDSHTQTHTHTRRVT